MKPKTFRNPTVQNFNLHKLLLFVVFACGSCGKGIQTASTDAECNSSLQFEKDIRPLLVAGSSGNCGACHPNKYDDFSGIKNDRQEVYSEISNGKMPKGNKNFKNSADGKQVLRWLNCRTLK